MTWHDEPTSFTKLAGPNRARTLTIGFEQNANCENLPMDPTKNPPDRRARRTSRTARVTATPDTPAPKVSCPTCDRPLVYRQTVIGGVKPLERWDYFECRTCGRFVYRQRTRTLRRSA
jgi:hypothetical protein